VGVKGRVAEIFESIQGEGLYSGARQIFVRFFGCNLECKFCDTKLDKFLEYEPEALFARINGFNNTYHSVSFTGGEPVLQKDFLKEILKLTHQAGFKNYLETNGTLPRNLGEVIDYIDIIAMDIKLPSSTGQGEYWQEHREFLKIAYQKEVFIKTVICKSSALADLKKAIALISGLDRSIPFVLQPNWFEMDGVLTQETRYFKECSLRNLSNVRIIPQMHKFMGVR
jgi:organic radical activating enzyme